MDGPHDLGGKAGFGPIDVTAAPFPEDWEARQWALSKNLPVRGGTIDWWRHGIERMNAVTYMTAPYFVKWHANDTAQAIDQGLFTLEEVLAGKTASSADAASPKTISELEQQLKDNECDFSRPMTDPPGYRVGDVVRTIRTPTDGHTRLPAYARAAKGTVIAHHGGHIFPDDSAAGVERAVHLYTIEFSAPELWGEGANPDDSVCLDLWEPYLAAP